MYLARRIYFISILSLFVALMIVSHRSGAQNAKTVVLEEQLTSGPGWLTKDVLVYSDGTVMSTHLTTPGGPQSPQQLVTTLGTSEMASIESSIASIKEAPLSKLDPNQNYNPGGFARTYSLVNPNGPSFVFAKNVSGVDLGLPDSQGRDLVVVLDHLSSLPL